MTGQNVQKLQILLFFVSYIAHILNQSLSPPNTKNRGYMEDEQVTWFKSQIRAKQANGTKQLIG